MAERLPEVWPEGYDRIVLEETDSTMAEAGRRLAGLVRPTWILARRQTAARGRRGRTWTATEGAFSATLAMRPGGNAAGAALRSFVAANALFETLAMQVDRARLALKWPNDVLLDGGKVAGILLESAGTGGRIDWLAIGIGVNLAHAPPPESGVEFEPVALGADLDPERVLDILAGNYATGDRLFEEFGFGPIREDWLRHAARLGEVITAVAGDEEITGRFETVDEAGNLVLETSDGLRRIAAAEVHFR